MLTKEIPVVKFEIDEPWITEREEKATQIVEVAILPPVDVTDRRKVDINNGITEIDKKLDTISERIEELNAEIDSLTNQADGLDYAVAVASGIITGLIDSFFVGETEIDIEKIQATLEEKYHTANDDEYRHTNKDGKWTDSATYHRLDDLAHHPTVLGLVAAILVRYFRLVVFVDGQDGKPHIFFADKSANEKTRKLEKEQLIKAWVGVIFSGLFMWLANIAENKCDEVYDGEMPEALRKIINMLGSAPLIIEFLKTADVWIGHMMSDVSTSQGIPGVFLSLLKELSALPVIRDTKLPALVDDLYNSGVMNLSVWGGVVFTAAKKQAMPVIINEALVRGFYFVRRLITEYRTHQNFKKVNWDAVIPLGNRTVERMMTIASGTFVAFDVADSAIRSGGFNASCILRINFVGIGRFAVAIGTDVAMGIKKHNKEQERSEALSEYINLANIKIYYRKADLLCAVAEIYEQEAAMCAIEKNIWQEVQLNHESMKQLYAQIISTCQFYKKAISQMDKYSTEMVTAIPKFDRNRPGLRAKMLERL